MYFLLLFQQLIASGTHIIAKSLTLEVSPPVVLLFRAMSVTILYLIVIAIGRKRFPKIERKDYLMLLGLGILNIPINQFLFLTSMKMTSAPNVALAYALTPAFVFLIGTIFYRDIATKLKVFGLTIAILGAGIIISEKGVDLYSEGFSGDILALLASLSWALYTVWGKKISMKYGAIYISGLTMIIGFLTYVPVFLALNVEWNIADISTKNWLQILYLGLITSGLSYAIWYYALTKIDASKVSVFNNLQPALTTLLSMFFFAFYPSVEFVIGASLIIVGVVVTQKG